MKHQPIILPPDPQGQTLSLDTSGNPLLIVGANGAGKSLFAQWVADHLTDPVMNISVLAALFERDDYTKSRSVIDILYADAVAKGMPHNSPTTQLERLIALLMHDEMLNLLDYKLRHATDPAAELRPTRLDTVIELWREIFPDNKILIANGSLLFQRDKSDDAYSALRLSTGERAVIYYLGAMAYAPEGATVMVDSPEMFLNPSILQSVWNRLELMRPDCRFVYTTHDLDFASSRQNFMTVWVQHFDAPAVRWTYSLLPENTPLGDDVYQSVIGSRKPVLFIEGDGLHSIDSKLYPLVFRDYTVQSLGSCNKVIEATRTFNDLNSFHNMVSVGIVDRDRRDAHEVDYLRRKNVMVPEVAEVENILMLEEVIMAVAARHGRDGQRAVARVKKAIINQFAADLKQQALQHTRHRVKRTVEYRIDGRFTSINTLEKHVQDLWQEVNPRGLYEDLCREFRSYVAAGDYAGVLRVYNQKSMLSTSNVAQLCGLQTKEQYIASVIKILRNEEKGAAEIRSAIMKCFNLEPHK